MSGMERAEEETGREIGGVGLVPAWRAQRHCERDGLWHFWGGELIEVLEKIGVCG